MVITLQIREILGSYELNKNDFGRYPWRLHFGLCLGSFSDRSQQWNPPSLAGKSCTSYPKKERNFKILKRFQFLILIWVIYMKMFDFQDMNFFGWSPNGTNWAPSSRTMMRSNSGTPLMQLVRVFFVEVHQVSNPGFVQGGVLFPAMNQPSFWDDFSRCLKQIQESFHWWFLNVFLHPMEWTNH